MKILYATDGLAPAVEAGKLITSIADPETVEIGVLSLATFEVFVPESPSLISENLQERRERASQIAKLSAANLIESGFEAHPTLAEGAPGPRTIEVAEREGYELVVMGAGTRSWLAHTLLGSVSTYVLHSSPTSVLIVHDSPQGDVPHRILVTTDGSVSSLGAAEALAKLADPSKCNVVVLSVAEVPIPAIPPPLPFGGGIFPNISAIETEATRERIEHAKKAASATASLLATKGFKARAEVAEGSPIELILKYSESEEFDLVVAGSRGLGPARRFFLGSVSDQIVRHTRAALIGRSSH